MQQSSLPWSTSSAGRGLILGRGGGGKRGKINSLPAAR